MFTVEVMTAVGVYFPFTHTSRAAALHTFREFAGPGAAWVTLTGPEGDTLAHYHDAHAYTAGLTPRA